jgi:hypothetical protein
MMASGPHIQDRTGDTEAIDIPTLARYLPLWERKKDYREKQQHPHCYILHIFSLDRLFALCHFVLAHDFSHEWDLDTPVSITFSVKPIAIDTMGQSHC